MIGASVAVTVFMTAIGCRDASTPSANRGTPAGSQPEPWFEDIARKSGVMVTYRSGQRGHFNLPEIMGGGAALFDMDADGDLDLYVVQAGNLADGSERPGNRLFRNRGDGVFEDVTSGSGADLRAYGMGVAAGDYDNDGDIDLYVTNLGPNALLRNETGGRFTNVTASAGVGDPAWSMSAAFFDFDIDGDLDLFVTNYINWSPASERNCYSVSGARDYCSPMVYASPTRDTLYRNNGDGTFADISGKTGLGAAFGNGLGIVTGDFDRNGRPDVFVANDAMMNQLWLNHGNGQLEDAALIRGVALDGDGVAKAGMGVHAIDHDDDGDLDLLVVNLDGQSDSFYRNEGSFFTDDTAVVGLRVGSRRFTRFGTALLDFNNDGLLDLYQANGRVGLQSERFSDDPYAEPNLLFRGTAAGRFEEVNPRGGTATPLIATSRGAAFGDLDNDGGIDIVVINRDAPAYILRNRAPVRGHWALVRVIDEHGRDAIGATVRATIGRRVVTRDVSPAFSYLSANDPRIHFGLGAERRLGDVVVKWLDGREESFGDIDADRVIGLRRGTGQPRR
jgi:hypothetical protein